MHADDGGYAQALGENGGMRQGAAVFGDKRGQALLVQQNDIRRRGFPRNQNAEFAAAGLPCLQWAVLVQQRPENSRDHVVDIVPARFQVAVFHLIEHPTEAVPLHLQRPFGIAVALAYQADDTLGDGAIGHHQKVGIYEGGNLRRCIFGNAVADLFQLLARALERPLESRYFLRHLPRIDCVFGNVQVRAGHLVHAPDDDAA